MTDTSTFVWVSERRAEPGAPSKIGVGIFFWGLLLACGSVLQYIQEGNTFPSVFGYWSQMSYHNVELVISM